MNKPLIWWFCYLPHGADSSKINWREEASLKRNLEQILESECDSTIEGVLHFLLQYLQGNRKSIFYQHLQAYLFRIASQKARELDREWQGKSWYASRFNCWDLSQEGFLIASETAKFWANYDSERGLASRYAYRRMKSKIREKLWQSVDLTYTEKKLETGKKYWNLKNQSGKKLKDALKALYYGDLEIETHFLAWQCFKELYAPAKGQEHNPPTTEQLEQMAGLFLQKRSPELKKDNSPVDVEFIHQSLENCISSLYKHNERRQELSLDMNVGSEDSKGTTYAEIIADEKGNEQFEEFEWPEFFREFYQNLDREQRTLLVFSCGCGLTTREIAALDAYNCHPSTISRKLDSIKELWLNEFYKKNRGDRESEKWAKKIMKDPSQKKLVNQVWKKYESDSYWLIYQAFQKVLQQLELSYQEILELYRRRQQIQPNTPELSLTAIEEDRIADFFQVLVSGIVQELEAELEMSLAFYKPFIQKIRHLVDEFLIRIYQENIH